MDDADVQRNLRSLHRKRRRLLRRLIVVGLVAVGLLMWLWPTYATWLRPSKSSGVSANSGQATSSTQPTSGKLEKGTPGFTTVTPKGESADTFGGWTRVSPPDSAPVFAYADKVSGVAVIVSEQQLPDTFARDTAGQLADFAKAYNANRTIETPNKTTVYIGTSSKGPQSLIIAKNDLLILIKSDTALNDEQWSEYIDSLK